MTLVDQQIHVMHVTLSLDFGGLERVVLHLAKQAERLKQRVSLLCLERPGALAEGAEALGATVYCIHKQPGLKLGAIKDVHEAIKPLRPDVLHTHQIGALFYAGPAARQLKVPVIVHTEHGKQIKGLKQKTLAWWAARNAQRFYCVSSDIQQGLAGSEVPQHKMEVIANGIDVAQLQQPVDTAALRHEWKIPDDAKVIGTIGRLARVKRQDLMLEVFALLVKKMPNCYLLLVGDGEDRQKLEAQAESLGVAEKIRFTGFQTDPGKFLHLMSVFLLTSESEGMPLSLLEAWAAGVPVLAFAVGGLPELVQDGETGFLAPFGDVKKMADQVVALLQDTELTKKIVQRSSEKVANNYDVATMADQYDRRYRELLAGRHR